MKKLLIAGAALVMLAAAGLTYAATWNQKLPKCSGQLCRDSGCSPDVICVSGSKVKNCADVCRGN